MRDEKRELGEMENGNYARKQNAGAALPCAVVRDLLPFYVEGLTSAETQTLVDTHLAGCEDCRDVCAAMRRGEDTVATDDKAELDFLKKTKQRMRRTVFASAFGVVLLVGVVLFVRFFLVGEAYAAEGLCTVDVSVAGNSLSVSATPIRGENAISKIQFEESTDENGNAVIYLTPRYVLRSPFHNGIVSDDYTAENEIAQVRLWSRILWDDGEAISTLAARVFSTRHEYVGEMPANGETATALNISGYLGAYMNELQTEKEPYGWTFVLTDDLAGTGSDKVSGAALKKRVTERENDMKMFGYVLLSMIKNLGEVTFSYRVDGEPTTLTVTTDDATAFFGQDIKDCYESVRLLDRLLEKTGILDYE